MSRSRKTSSACFQGASPAILHSAREKKWRAPSERIRTASEIPFEVNLTDEDAIPTYARLSEKAFHLSRLGMTYADICKRLNVNRWMALGAVRWGKIHRKRPIASADKSRY